VVAQHDECAQSGLDSLEQLDQQVDVFDLFAHVAGDAQHVGGVDRLERGFLGSEESRSPRLTCRSLMWTMDSLGQLGDTLSRWRLKTGRYGSRNMAYASHARRSGTRPSAARKITMAALWSKGQCQRR